MHEMNSGHVGHAVHSGGGGSVVAAARKSKFTACGRTDGRPPCGTRLGRATGVRRSAWTVALVLAAMATFAAGAPMTFEASRVADPVRSLQPVDQLFLQVSWAGDDLVTSFRLGGLMCRIRGIGLPPWPRGRSDMFGSSAVRKKPGIAIGSMGIVRGPAVCRLIVGNAGRMLKG